MANNGTKVVRLIVVFGPDLNFHMYLEEKNLNEVIISIPPGKKGFKAMRNKE